MRKAALAARERAEAGGVGALAGALAGVPEPRGVRAWRLLERGGAGAPLREGSAALRRELLPSAMPPLAVAEVLILGRPEVEPAAAIGEAPKSAVSTLESERTLPASASETPSSLSSSAYC